MKIYNWVTRFPNPLRGQSQKQILISFFSLHVLMTVLVYIKPSKILGSNLSLREVM